MVRCKWMAQNCIFLTTPGGAAGQLKVSSRDGRLENGIMISQNALDELGEKEFIKMLRFY